MTLVRQIEDRIERDRAAKFAKARAVEVRRQAAQLETAIFRLEKRFASVKDLPDKVIRAAHLVTSLIVVEKEIARLPDAAQRTIIGRATALTITELEAQLLRLLVSQELVRESYGAHLSDVRKLARAILADKKLMGPRRRSATPSSFGLAADALLKSKSKSFPKVKRTIPVSKLRAHGLLPTTWKKGAVLPLSAATLTNHGLLPGTVKRCRCGGR